MGNIKPICHLGGVMIMCNDIILYLPYASLYLVGKQFVQKTNEAYLWVIPFLGYVKVYPLTSCIFSVPVFHDHQRRILRIFYVQIFTYGDMLTSPTWLLSNFALVLSDFYSSPYWFFINVTI